MIFAGALALASGIGIESSQAAFGLTTTSTYYQVDTGAGLVFKVRRTDNGVSTQSAGDLMSLVWNGTEFQNQSRGSQVNSGFDWLYNGTSSVSVSASVVNSNYIKVTVQAGDLTHYYLARNGYSHIYMGTYFTSEPSVHGHVRYIVRIPSSLLPNGPAPSDIRNNTGAIESGDVFGLANGETRSKHYSNMRLKDWSYFGATGSGVGVWMVRGNQEGGSGGPFYRSLLNQCGSDQELTYIVNYAQAQTEAYRMGVLNDYTLVFTGGGTPPSSIDTSWFASMGLNGYLAPSGRGRVAGVGINGRDTAYTYTVGFANTTAQHWVTARASDGYYSCSGMRPGTYTMTVYKNELGVDTRTVNVSAGGTTVLNSFTVANDPSNVSPIWRIGDWDGSPAEFRNGSQVTTMHPSDVRLANWNPGTFTIGSSGNSSFPCYQWKDVNGSQQVQFSLNASQASSNRTLRVGITCAYSNARPRVTVNSWTSSIPGISSQPGSRTLTTGSYRGNNTTYTFTVPSSALVAGTNTLSVFPVSGSGLSGYLSAGYSIDCVDFY